MGDGAVTQLRTERSVVSLAVEAKSAQAARLSAMWQFVEAAPPSTADFVESVRPLSEVVAELFPGWCSSGIR